MDKANMNIKDIAKLAGVGTTTVSRIINHTGGVKESTYKRVMEVIKEYNYVPNNSARNLKRIQSNAICVLTKGIANPAFNDMLSIIQKRSTEYGFDVMIQQIDQNEDELDTAIAQMKEKRLKGIILLGGILKNQGNKFKELNTPLVMVTSSAVENIDADQYSSITIDDRNGAYKAIKYLLDLGHKKIAVIASEVSSAAVVKLRLAGYYDALSEAGIELEPNLIINAENFSIESGYRAFKELNENNQGEFTAVFAMADTLAIGCLRAARDAGLSLPDDLSVIGFDGLDMGKYYVPSITTVEQPFSYMAEQAIDIMSRLLDGEKNCHLMLNTEIVERESCACIRRSAQKTGGRNV